MKRWAKEYWWVGVCAGLLGIYAVMAWSAVSQKSATFDEPLSVVSAWGAGELGDYRMDYEHPPLWKKWAWVGNWGSSVKVDLSAEEWREMGEKPMGKWKFAHDVMYATAENDPHALLRGARGMMLLLAVMGGAVVAWWAWGMGGGVAAVVAAGLYAFDPNFLGHGALVKNDVGNAVVSAAVIAMTWLVGRRLTWGRVAGLAVLCGGALVVKLSAVMLGPIVAGLLVGRAVLGGGWKMGRGEIKGVGRRLGVAVGVCVFSAMVTVGVVWGAYGFRYAATPVAGYRIDFERLAGMEASRAFAAKHPRRQATAADMAGWKPGGMSRVIMELNERHVMPEAWLAGVMFTERTATGDRAYLNGESYYGGKWYYFLEAMGVKTLVGTLVGVMLAGVWLMKRGTKSEGRVDGWGIACLVGPVGAMMVGSCFAELNLGVRYMLPMYPMLFVMIGVAAAGVWRSGVGRGVVVLVGGLVVGESLWAYPNYIAFFNWPAGGSRGGVALLGDSNLDWGQDLPAVAEWQKRHAGEELYLSYFGMADPASWGIRYHNLPGGYAYGPKEELPTGEAYLLIGATNLQGIYFKRDLYEYLRTQEPVEVLGGTVYVYRLVR